MAAAAPAPNVLTVAGLGSLSPPGIIAQMQLRE